MRNGGRKMLIGYKKDGTASIKNGLPRQAEAAIALIGLVVAAPLIALAAIAVAVTSRGPVIFRQKRMGRKGRPFTMYKLRTMKMATSGPQVTAGDDIRVTPVGKFLRKTKLDELPELWHVLMGKMSLVGPRPLLMHYLPLYTSEQIRRHDVRPGITGWAQVNGRNDLSWEEKFALDVWYVDHASLALDLRILGMTVWKIIRREGVQQPGQATAEEFRGGA